MGFEEKSYENHKAFKSSAFDKSKIESWKNKDNIDYWRHKRMYKNLDSVIDSYPHDSWLTIGDGRYGTDANYILSKGIKNVLATDISETHLKLAVEDNFINDYSIENAEKLSFGDNSFDFVLCKEAYHHFPRPMIALYEMLRVARKGVFLIEPSDQNLINYDQIKVLGAIRLLFSSIKRLINNRLGRSRSYNFGNYEPVGNYIYSISKRELEKASLGLNLKYIIHREQDDYYEEGVEFENATSDSLLFKKVKKAIEKKERKASIQMNSFSLLTTGIFKESPSELALKEFKNANFEIIQLPRNPYLQ